MNELGLASLDQVPDAVIDRIAGLGFEWVYLLGVWQTGEAGRRVSRTNDAIRAGYAHDLPEWTEADVAGSPFAVTEYRVHRDFGGDTALAELRQRMRRKGLRTILDFVPNHLALDHPWATSHPERFIPGAYGGDAWGSWVDTLQVDYRNAEVIEAMIAELISIAERCDGVRCDMAMLVHPEVFERNWGGKALELWPRAIREVKARHPDFVFVAETYFLHWELMQQGFDFAYDKILYDRLVAQDAGAVRAHLQADHSFQKKVVRFLENHDEPRAARSFPPDVHRAAAVIAFFAPGMVFVHDGQLEGRRFHANIHLARRAMETPDLMLLAFYERLLSLLDLAKDDFFLCQPRSAWDGNSTHERFVIFRRGSLLIAANYGPTRAQCHVTVGGFEGDVLLDDRLNDVRYVRNGEELATRGLYLDMPAWGHHVFALDQNVLGSRAT